MISKNITDVLLGGFEAGDTAFINWETITKRGNTALKDAERKNLFERIDEAYNRGYNFIVIVDEEHLNKTVKALKEYVEDARPYLIKDENEEALFVNVNGTRLTRQGFWKIVKYYKEQAHIDKDITPHVLRHSFATHLLQNGADLKAIQTMLGHSDISSTQVYMQFQDPAIKNTYKKADPVI